MKKTNIGQLKEITTSIYNYFGWKIPNFYRSLLLFPDYLSVSDKILLEIFEMPGPLKIEDIYSICLMTAAN